jgi:hypothetical protein
LPSGVLCSREDDVDDVDDVDDELALLAERR